MKSWAWQAMLHWRVHTSNGIQNRNRRMRNRMYGGVRGRKTKVGEKLLRFPPTRLFHLLCFRTFHVSSFFTSKQGQALAENSLCPWIVAWEDENWKWKWPKMTMTGNDRFSIQDILPFLLKKKKFVQVTGALLHFDSLFCTFAPAIERKLLLHRKSVFTDDTFESRLMSGAGRQWRPK